MDPVNVPAKFEVRNFTRSWDRPNTDWSFGWGLQTFTLGSRMVPPKRTLVSSYRPSIQTIYSSISTRLHESLDRRFGWGLWTPNPTYRPSIVTFCLCFFLCFRDIASFVFQHTTFPYPTSSFRQIAPCSPGIRWMAFGLRRAKANCPCI